MTAKQNDISNSPEALRLAKFLLVLNSFDDGMTISAVPARGGFILTPELAVLAEAFLEHWIPWSEFVALSAAVSVPPPPEDGREYLECLHLAAGRIVESIPTAGNA